MKKGYTGLKRLLYATQYSYQGLRASWESEAAIRQELLLIMFLVPITFLLNITSVEQVMLLFSLALIVVAELLNTALETVVDRIGHEFNTVRGKAKDICSAAVFISLVTAFLTWLIILW